MDKITAGLIGAVAGLATIGSASAAVPTVANPAEALHAASYTELLAPVENAAALLKADDARIEAQLRTVQYYRGYGYDQGYGARDHHHHHHHQDYRRYSYNGPENYHHHHHHHHHHNYGGGILGQLLNGR